MWKWSPTLPLHRVARRESVVLPPVSGTTHENLLPTSAVHSEKCCQPARRPLEDGSDDLTLPAARDLRRDRGEGHRSANLHPLSPAPRRRVTDARETATDFGVPTTWPRSSSENGNDLPE